jgi:hypothetical protein
MRVYRVKILPMYFFHVIELFFHITFLDLGLMTYNGPKHLNLENEL